MCLLMRVGPQYVPSVVHRLASRRVAPLNFVSGGLGEMIGNLMIRGCIILECR